MPGTRELLLASVAAALGLVEAEGPRFPVSTDATGCVVEPITSEPYDEFQFQGVSRDGEWLSYGVNLAYWTRDGEYIYFNSERNGNTDIFRMRMNGLDCESAGRAR